MKKVVFMLVLLPVLGLVFLSCSRKDDFDNDLIGEVVEFGLWPQTIANVENVKLKKTGKTYDGNPEYSGDDGNLYVMVEKARTHSSSYCFSNDKKIIEGETYWFFVEPVEWKVVSLNNRTKTLVSEKILTSGINFYENTNVRSVANETVWPNNYKYSDIRNYLNGSFYNSVFSFDEKLKVSETTVDNGEDTTSSRLNKYACENTKDRVFLLSYQEACSSDLGFSCDNDRIRQPSDYALANNCYKSSREGQGGWWWLRSPYGGVSYYVRIVWGGGNLDYKDSVDNRSMGIIPAISVLR